MPCVPPRMAPILACLGLFLPSQDLGTAFSVPLVERGWGACWAGGVGVTAPGPHCPQALRGIHRGLTETWAGRCARGPVCHVNVLAPALQAGIS